MKEFELAYSAWVSSPDYKIHQKMYDYYVGDTDAIRNYKMVTERSNNKVRVNFIKKFIKEEVSYSVGNDITYVSKSGNKQVIQDIDYYLENWSEEHDANVMKNMLIYSVAYELYYFNEVGEFCSRIIPATEGYGVTDENNNVVLFIRRFKKPLDDTIYLDFYKGDSVYHYTEDMVVAKSNGKGVHKTGFPIVPVTQCLLSSDGVFDTLYSDLKGLQDAYETNLSDISNEISDFRNAYLTFIGTSICKDDVPLMKKLGILNAKDKDAKISFITKDINDTFIQNTLSTLEDKIYQIACHINHNEKMQSNTSSLALRSRLISLEEKCKLNQKSMNNVIKSRLKFLFMYLKMVKNLDYDYKDIKIKFTPNIPQDDLMTAQIISQLGDLLSEETSLSLLSFIENPEIEKSKKSKEVESLNAGLTLLGVGENEPTL